ncbi:MAG: NUDIX domain-containing protein [Halorhabdus sp.]
MSVEEWRQAAGRRNDRLLAEGLESEDNSAAAVERELAEETGYDPGYVEYMAAVEPANGVADAVSHYQLAKECRSTAERISMTTSRSWSRRRGSMSCAKRPGWTIYDGRTRLGVLYGALFVDTAERNP